MGVPTDHSKRDECGESDNFVESSTLTLIVEMPRRVCVDNELQEKEKGKGTEKEQGKEREQ
jgi:hypothetical protein